MPLHEQKLCPRCAKGFECRVGDICRCECTSIQLTLEEQAFIEGRYQDCLCLSCLKDLQNKYVLFREKYFE